MTEELTDYTRHKGLVDGELPYLVEARQKLKKKEKAIKDELGDINEEISGLMATLENKAVLCDGWKVTLSESIRRTLKKDILLTLGVDTEIIAQATIESVSTRLTVSEIKE